MNWRVGTIYYDSRSKGWLYTCTEISDLYVYFTGCNKDLPYTMYTHFEHDFEHHGLKEITPAFEVLYLQKQKKTLDHSGGDSE